MPVSGELYGPLRSEMSVAAGVLSYGANGWLSAENTYEDGSGAGCAVISWLKEERSD